MKNLKTFIETLDPGRKKFVDEIGKTVAGATKKMKPITKTLGAHNGLKESDDMGPVKAKPNQNVTVKNKTSGKELVIHKNALGAYRKLGYELVEGWGAKAQGEARTKEAGEWKAMHAKHKDNPDMAKHLKDLHNKGWKPSYAETEAKKKCGLSEATKVEMKKAIKKVTHPEPYFDPFHSAYSAYKKKWPECSTCKKSPCECKKDVKEETLIEEPWDREYEALGSKKAKKAWKEWKKKEEKKKKVTEETISEKYKGTLIVHNKHAKEMEDALDSEGLGHSKKEKHDENHTKYHFDDIMSHDYAMDAVPNKGHSSIYEEVLDESPENAWRNRMKAKGAAKFIAAQKEKESTSQYTHALDKEGKRMGTFNHASSKELSEHQDPWQNDDRERYLTSPEGREETKRREEEDEARRQAYNKKERERKAAKKKAKNEGVEMETKEQLVERAKMELHVKKGAFHKWLGKKEGESITSSDIEKGLAAGGHAAKMANFAKNAKHWHHESFMVEGIVDHEKIANHLIKTHGKDIDKEGVKAACQDMDEPHKIDHDEVWQHVMAKQKQNMNERALDTEHGAGSQMSAVQHTVHKGGTPLRSYAKKEDAEAHAKRIGGNVVSEEVELMEGYKVGDKVIPTVGPHKGHPHEVIHVHMGVKSGQYNIKPIGLKASQILYRLGAAQAEDHQLKRAKDTFKDAAATGNPRHFAKEEYMMEDDGATHRVTKLSLGTTSLYNVGTRVKLLKKGKTHSTYEVTKHELGKYNNPHRHWTQSEVGKKVKLRHDVVEPLTEEVTLDEGKMSELHLDVSSRLDKHIKAHKAGQMGADTLGDHAVRVGKNLAKQHGMEHKHMQKLVNDYVDGQLKESSDIPFDGPYSKTSNVTPAKGEAGRERSTVRKLARDSLAKIAKDVHKGAKEKFDPNPKMTSLVFKT